MTHDLRTKARVLFDAAVSAADPAKAVRRGMTERPPRPPGPGGRSILIGIGKAAPAMVAEALRHIPTASVALAVTHHENLALAPGVEVLRAGHPVPDAAGAAAARRVMAVLSETREADRVIALISGGGSALLPAPPKGVSLEDKAALNALLLSAGLDIVQMNLVRQQVSLLKGGGFLRRAAPASVQAYILSDVIGDDLRAIASGPTVSPIGTASEARDLLEKTEIWPDVPASIRAHLSVTTPPEPDAVPPADNVLIGSNRLSLDAMARAAHDIGLDPEMMNPALTGDVADAAARIIAAMTPVTTPTALLFGGETTVRLRGTGRGGRNQELALRVALGAPEMASPWVFLSGGTDGRDGPTDAAGGIVDADTHARMSDVHVDADALLANNDSYAALAASGDLLITGATGTNVADVQALLILP